MDFLEKDLEDIIYEASDEQLTGIDLSGKRFRQLKIGNYGVSDLVFVRRHYNHIIDYDNQVTPILNIGLEIIICELKKDKICLKTFDQALKYARGISKYLKERDFEKFFISILLVGRTVEKTGSFLFLNDLFSQDQDKDFGDEIEFNGKIRDIRIYTFSYDFDGIKFNEHSGYYIP